jgi:uncharacterized protein
MTRTLAFFALLLTATTTAAPAATVTHIIADGHATVAVMPDEATIRATIQTNADRAEDATAQNNTTYTHITDAAVKSGVGRSDITLAYYNVAYNPKPSPRPGELAPSGTFGYVVTRAFDVKVSNVTKAGNVVDALVGAGVTSVDNVSFDASNPAHARSEAIAKALAAARSKAEDAARAAGLHIVGIAEINFGGGAIVQPRMMAVSAMRVEAPTTFDSGNVNVNADLTVVFLAEP